MHDLTQGSISKHILRLAAPMAAGMVFQTLYYFVDLYFVAKLGEASIAGVSAAGNLQFIVMALTQILGVGTMVLISHAAGRKDRVDANLVFNQSLVFAAVCAMLTLAAGYAFSGAYMNAIGASAATSVAGASYLRWYLPALALQFAMITLGSALRGTGIAKPMMIVQVFTVLLNAVLAPVLIAGWITHKPMGTAGAGLASSIAVGVGVVMLWTYFLRLEKFVSIDTSLMRAQFATWLRILKIGLPAGGEFALMFVMTATTYFIIRDFGASAQAGYGLGSRIMQGIFLPAMAVAFAAAPIAGQNVGAGLADRTRETFRSAAMIGSIAMFITTLLCQWRADWLLKVFTSDAAVITVGAQFLHVISWNFVAQGLIFTCSGMFQALGNTVPSMISSATRVITFALPAIWLSHRAGFALKQMWLLSVITVTGQTVISLLLLRRELNRKLNGVTARVVVPVTLTA